MNKLYVIRFKLSNDYTVSTWHTWDEQDALDKIQKNPEWEFTVVEDNGVHQIWDAK